MRYLATLIAAALAIAGTAPLSAEPKKPPLTNAEALSMLQALRNLDGRITVVKQGDKDTTVMVPWEFGSGTLRLRIARNVTALAAVEKAIEDARLAIVKEILKGSGPDVTTVPEGAPMDSFRKQVADMLGQGAAVDLSRIRASELRLDKNEIPVTVLSGLSPILDDDVTK